MCSKNVSSASFMVEGLICNVKALKIVKSIKAPLTLKTKVIKAFKKSIKYSKSSKNYLKINLSLNNVTTPGFVEWKVDYHESIP